MRKTAGTYQPAIQIVVGLCFVVVITIYLAFTPSTTRLADFSPTGPVRATGAAQQADRPRCVHGSLLLNVCFCDPGFVGRTCEKEDIVQPPPCSATNDLCFHNRHNGVCKVSEERWKRAQEAEGRFWRGSTATSDRKDDHLEGFNNYTDVPEFLGSVLEIGCGPYTQLFLLDQPKKWVVDNITLWEPGAKDYIANTPGCAYKDGKLRGRAVTVIPLGAEHLNVVEEFDTVMMINTLEHVQNLYTVLGNLHRALRPGGILIFNDRWWDHYEWARPVDAGKHIDHLFHPIRCSRRVFEHFLSHFQPLYQVVNPHAITKHDYDIMRGIYYIGMKSF